MSSLSDESFDSYAGDYEGHLAQGLRLSGESSDYFAQERIRLVCELLAIRGGSPSRILDYGCGTGNATPFLRKELAPEHIVSVDPSRKSIETLKEKYAGPDLTAIPLDEHAPSGDIDACLCNGVFHHIPPEERLEAIRIVHDSLCPGGLFFFWENNPWNPATHVVMKLIPFDRNAIKMFPFQARRLLREAGFTVRFTRFRFIFPKIFSFLRKLERPLGRIPLGCQYLVVAEK